MCQLLILFVLLENILLIQSRVTLYKNNFLSAPNSTSLELKCDFHLERDKQFVQRVDISKDKHVFFSVEYSHGNARVNGQLDVKVPPPIIPVTNFTRVSGIRELEYNNTKIDSNRNEGWISIHIKRGDKPIPGTYRCKVYYLAGTQHSNIESDKVLIVDKKEKVKFRINNGHEIFHKGQNIKMECKYELLKKDMFAGLSLVKDHNEFFRYFHNKNHSFVKVPGVDHITWSESTRAIYLTIQRAHNITQGNYACLFNFSNPDIEEKVVTLRDSSHIIFKNSTDNKLSKTWILLLFVMIYKNY